MSEEEESFQKRLDETVAKFGGRVDKDKLGIEARRISDALNTSGLDRQNIVIAQLLAAKLIDELLSIGVSKEVAKWVFYICLQGFESAGKIVKTEGKGGRESESTRSRLG